MSKDQMITSFTAALQGLSVGDTVVISQHDWDSIHLFIEAMDFLLPLPVTEYVAYRKGIEGIYYGYELCPKCGKPLERTYQAHCDNCGQRLKWISKKLMTWKK